MKFSLNQLNLVLAGPMSKIGPNWSYIPHGTGSRIVTVQYLRLDQIGPMSHMGPGPISDIGPSPMWHMGLAYYWQVCGWDRA